MFSCRQSTQDQAKLNLLSTCRLRQATPRECRGAIATVSLISSSKAAGEKLPLIDEVYQADAATHWQQSIIHATVVRKNEQQYLKACYL
jgi:hypothetical protein